MTLTEIENLSAAELKSRKDELVAAASQADPAELAVRYVQARTDASLRDEKLSEQGKTITTLQGAFDQLKASAQADLSKLGGIVAELQQRVEKFVDAVSQKDAAIANLNLQIVEHSARADRLKVEAGRNLAALNSAASAMTSALTTIATALGQQAVESADQGN